MKPSLLKHLSAAALSAVMVFTSIPITVYAAEETVIGAEETIKVSSATSERERSFNDGWKFYLGDNSSAQNKNFDDSGWNAVMLPHDFSISQNFTTSGEAESGFLPGGTGWYRKTFTMAESDYGKSVVLNFDGAYMHSYVYVNGVYVGENHYGYTAFSFDITDYLTCDGVTENVIAVKVVNQLGSSRWYSGSGIYRDVTLIVTDPVHIENNGVFVTTPDISSGDGTAKTQVELKNDSSSSARVTVKNTVYDSDGVSVYDTEETTVTVDAGATETATTYPVVKNPKLWSTDDPNLYTVHTEIYVDDILTDSTETTFGYRWYSFDGNTGFSLNGQKLKLKGVCMHHDQGAAGSAAYYDAMYRQLKSMKDMGANAIRVSHNPADEHYIDICNELGLMVIEEAFDSWTAHKNGNDHDFGEYFNTKIGNNNQIYGGNSNMTWAEFAIKSMVKRDRSDPSVILWSLGNEITGESNYPTVAQNLIKWVKEMDTTRQVTLGENSYPKNTNNYLGQVVKIIQDNGGVIGFNYLKNSNYHGLYSEMKNAWGTFYNSETTSSITGRGIYTKYDGATDKTYHLTSYDKSAVGWGLNANDSIYYNLSIDYLAGEFVWTGWDYIGEPTPWNGTGSGSQTGGSPIPNSSYFGIVDTAGFPKDNYYLYRSQWNLSDTTLHLVTAWDKDNQYVSGGKTPVVIYSNAPKVELFRNNTKIGTATRVEHTTKAGFKYYTYDVKSDNSGVCTAVSASDGDSLMATFNVAYEAGKISAKAYDSNGREITDTVGSKVVNTPGNVTKLNVTQDKTVINADGQSLVYIAVDVVDNNGNLDTTATNTIYFSLEGNGEIVGVDNGDQATTEKYQQTSVIDSKTEAHIKAYAGKALVIVKSTDEAGDITVEVTSNGLNGDNVYIDTVEVESEPVEGLVSYTMVRDYSVKVGTEPELQDEALGNFADGSTEKGYIDWNYISDEIYNAPGDYTVSGTLRFDGEEEISVTAKLHVIDNVIAVRNVSTVTTPNNAPILPSTVRGVLADGTLSGEFTVEWEEVDSSNFSEVGEIITVYGDAAIIGDETMPVTCTVRVANAVNTNSENAARKNIISLTQDVPEGKQSDNLNSVNNGYKEFVNSVDERWSNWNNRGNSATATLTFTWHTAALLSSANIYYYYDETWSRKPANVEFLYSLDGQNYNTVGYTEEWLADDDNGNDGQAFSYEFDDIINPISFKIKFTQQGGTTQNHCVAVIEAELMTFAGTVEVNSSADLSAITVDDAVVENFSADTFEYDATGSEVSATTIVNAGITILPEDEYGVVRILTVSEDGETANTYEVALEHGCRHENTEIRDAKEATCTEEGYTGDTYCTTCGDMIEKGSTIGKLDHTTELINAKEATCIEEGYTGDTYCTDCGDMIEEGEAIPVNDNHSWDGGVVTVEPTEDEKGVMTYTCTACGGTREEPIDELEKELKVPSVTLTVTKGSNGKIKLKGYFEGYDNQEDYFPVVEHGFVYLPKIRLGARYLNVNTAGRTKVKCTYYYDDGTYVYNMTPKTESTRYAIRAYLVYKGEDNMRHYVYSYHVFTEYESLE